MIGRRAQRDQLGAGEVDLQHSRQFRPAADPRQGARLTESNAVAEPASFEDKRSAAALDRERRTTNRSPTETLSKNISQVFSSDDSFLRSVQGDLFGAPGRVALENLNTAEARADARTFVLVQRGNHGGVCCLETPGRGMAGTVINHRDQVRTSHAAPDVIGSAGPAAAIGVVERVGRRAAKPEDRRRCLPHRVG